MIGSAIYRAVVEHFAKNVQQDPKSKKKFIFKGFSVQTPKRVSTPKQEKPENFDKYDDKYHNAYKTFADKKNAMKDEVDQTYQNANKQLDKKQVDTSDNEIEYLDKLLFKKSELNTYSHLATSHNFNLTKLITDWVDKLHNIVYAKSE
jgi:hypothetical protein